MWLLRFFSSSIGKKILMAATGLLLLLFLIAHAIGNAAIFFGSKAFQTYADSLHSLPVVVFVFGLGLLVVFVIHISIGVQLFLQNRKTGASRYAVTTRVVKNTFASSTMPYTGLLILLFVVIHVFGFGVNPAGTAVSILVKDLLGNFFYGLFYLFSFGVLAVHLSHGFWSMLQTFGFNHPRYNDGIAKLTYIVPGFFLVFFGTIVLYFMTGIGAGY
jgi:succinate dehydrogenase / fumarate reductase, cytochrome b subunit